MTGFKIDTYAVIGNPISHSQSPFIHKAFAKQTHQSLQYIAIETSAENFQNTVLDFQQYGGKGLNITVPFKLLAWQLVQQRSERAGLAGAVNTIVFKENGQLYGDNTDGIGLVRDLTHNQKFSLLNKKILLLGAGGATQGVLAPLLKQNLQTISIANRTAAKAIKLANQFAKFGNIQPLAMDELINNRFDLIINATSASLAGELPTMLPAMQLKNTFCYDMAYGNQPTVFLQWAKQHGASHYVDGLGMLVEQAAEAFYLWQGVRPDSLSVIKILRASI